MKFDFCIFTAHKMISFSMLQNDEERKVILFHYTEWPCHSNPFSNALLEFRRRVRNVMNHHPDTQDGPVIVHCKYVASKTMYNKPYFNSKLLHYRVVISTPLFPSKDIATLYPIVYYSVFK